MTAKSEWTLQTEPQLGSGNRGNVLLKGAQYEQLAQGSQRVNYGSGSRNVNVNVRIRKEVFQKQDLMICKEDVCPWGRGRTKR